MMDLALVSRGIEDRDATVLYRHFSSLAEEAGAVNPCAIMISHVTHTLELSPAAISSYINAYGEALLVIVESCPNDKFIFGLMDLFVKFIRTYIDKHEGFSCSAIGKIEEVLEAGPKDPVVSTRVTVVYSIQPALSILLSPGGTTNSMVKILLEDAYLADADLAIKTFMLEVEPKNRKDKKAILTYLQDQLVECVTNPSESEKRPGFARFLVDILDIKKTKMKAL